MNVTGADDPEPQAGERAAGERAAAERAAGKRAAAGRAEGEEKRRVEAIRKAKHSVVFFDGLTGVVDALRDQVMGASAEPVRLTTTTGDHDSDDGDEGKKKWSGKSGGGGGGGAEVSRGADAAGAGAAASAGHRRQTGAGAGAGESTGAGERTKSWEVDGEHLATVSRVWDMDVVTFREELVRRGIDDSLIVTLQKAINETAYEHFVAAGMRRYRLNNLDDEEFDE